MANIDNECNSLNVNKEKSEDFDYIFELQSQLQERLGYNFDKMSLKEVCDFWLFNKHAMSDELSEMFDALGGIKDGIGNAVWKKWKSRHDVADRIHVENLTDSDYKELCFEVVDMFHFAINFAISIGMSGSDLFNMYVSKNKENHNRQDNGY